MIPFGDAYVTSILALITERGFILLQKDTLIKTSFNKKEDNLTELPKKAPFPFKNKRSSLSCCSVLWQNSSPSCVIISSQLLLFIFIEVPDKTSIYKCLNV